MHLKNGTILQGGKYKIETILGKGGFGITYLACHTALDRKVAIKEFFMKDYCIRAEDTTSVNVPSVGSKDMVDNYRSKFIKEAQIIAKLDNPYIIQIYDLFEENGTAYYVMKYLDGESLGALIDNGLMLSVPVSCAYVRQVADALMYCHDRNISHLDIKPGNILIQDGSAVLIDFGVSKRYDDKGIQTSSTPACVSKGYAPMEQYKDGGLGQFSPTTDIYSLGATLYRLVVGKVPPHAYDVYADGLPAFPLEVPKNIQETITKAMSPKREDRHQSVKEFLDMLDKGELENTELALEETQIVEEPLVDSAVDFDARFNRYFNTRRYVEAFQLCLETLVDGKDPKVIHATRIVAAKISKKIMLPNIQGFCGQEFLIDLLGQKYKKMTINSNNEICVNFWIKTVVSDGVVLIITRRAAFWLAVLCCLYPPLWSIAILPIVFRNNVARYIADGMIARAEKFRSL